MLWQVDFSNNKCLDRSIRVPVHQSTNACTCPVLCLGPLAVLDTRHPIRLGYYLRFYGTSTYSTLEIHQTAFFFFSFFLFPCKHQHTVSAVFPSKRARTNLLG